jgi:uncharacterized membrane protein YgdD (TMEM256/DUF423 family)
MRKNLVRFAGFSGAIAVALGALGAHYLKQKVAAGALTADNVQSFDTAVKYHMYHTLAILCIAAMSEKLNKKFADYASIFFIIGILLFSGSIYLLSTRSLMGIEGMAWLGPITPIGGILFMTGWVLLAISAFKRKSERNGESNG